MEYAPLLITFTICFGLLMLMKLCGNVFLQIFSVVFALVNGVVIAGLMNVLYLAVAVVLGIPFFLLGRVVLRDVKLQIGKKYNPGFWCFGSS
jgi:hypothetical protein